MLRRRVQAQVPTAKKRKKGLTPHGVEHVRVVVNPDGSEEISVFGPPPTDPDDANADDGQSDVARDEVQPVAFSGRAGCGRGVRPDPKGGVLLRPRAVPDEPMMALPPERGTQDEPGEGVEEEPDTRPLRPRGRPETESQRGSDVRARTQDQDLVQKGHLPRPGSYRPRRTEEL